MNASTREVEPVRLSGDVRAALREATAAEHANVDAAFPEGLSTPRAYARYLRGMHRFALDFEGTTARTPRHSAWLAQDLAAVGLQPLAGTRRPMAADGDTATGWEYVMAGSSLGARYLVRSVRKLGHSGARGACFLEGHSRSDDWRVVQDRLAMIDIADAPRLARMIDGARDAFTHVAACLARGGDTAHKESAREPSP